MIEVRKEVLQKYSDLFGVRVINGREVVVEELIERLTREFRDEIDEVIRERRRWLDDPRPVREKAAFPHWDEKFVDADGESKTFREIVQGLIDNLLGGRPPTGGGLTGTSRRLRTYTR